MAVLKTAIFYKKILDIILFLYILTVLDFIINSQKIIYI